MAVGYYFSEFKQCLMFSSYSEDGRNYVQSKVEESHVGGWGDITEYDTYCIALKNGKKKDLSMWNLDRKKKVVIRNKGVLDFYYYGDTSIVEEVVIAKGATYINKKAFAYCTKLKKITIPASVKDIGENAFIGCVSLKEVIIENGLESIGNGAFEDCYALEELVLPDSLKRVENNSLFRNCNISRLVFPKSIEYIDHFCHDEDGNTLIKCFTVDNSGKNPNRVRTNSGSIARYVATSEETKLIEDEVKNWKLEIKHTTTHFNYGTDEKTYYSEDIKQLSLKPNYMIISGGKVVGYYYDDPKTTGYNYCFFFDKEPHVYEYKKTHTIGAYYYRDPHTQVVEEVVCSLVKYDA